MQYTMPMSQGRQLPEIRFRQIDLPQVSEMDVGECRYVVMKLEMIEKHTGKYMGMEDKRDGNQVEGTFRVLTTKVLGKDAVDSKSLESEEYNQVLVKVKSGEM